MPRGRVRSSGLSELVQGLGEQIGAELGRVIAQSVQRTLSSSIDVKEIARKLKGGRRTSKGICTEPGCGNPVLAKGLCRSHYYRARYRAQKAGTLVTRSRNRPT